MELSSKHLYEAFKAEILNELGPLDPNWFESLTAQVSAKDGSGSDQEDLCANQEGYFKAPIDRTATESQPFSTPKVFRHRRVVSPETEDEQSFTADQEKGKLPWTPTQSPYWLSKQRGPDDKRGGLQHQNQNGFDPIHTPLKSTASYAQQISESLGAHIDADISWTSSFNTPPLPSTLILSKTDERTCPLSLSTEKDIVFVRTLFPSLSNGSKVEATQPKDDDMPPAYEGAVSPEAHKSLQSPLNQCEDVWQQRLPDAIEDGEIRNTVASVLEGAENVLSVFFANSSSALRKVKPDRIKRRQIIQTKERCCSSADISTTNTVSSSKTKTAEQELEKCPSSTALSEWSPLSLSEIPVCTVDNNILTKQTMNSDSNNLIRPHVKITDSGFNRKKRKFSYTVGKPQDQEKDPQLQRIDSSQGVPHGQDVRVTQLVEAAEEADCSSIGKKASQKQKEHPTGEMLPPSVQARVQDLDMSQLCRDFAQDFSQMSESGKPSKSVEDTQTFFSPSVCLSAMKQAKQKARQANVLHDCEGFINRKHVSTTNPSYSINEGTIGDSGFQSAVADIALTTSSSFVLPCSDNTRQVQQCSGFKVDNYQTTSSTTERNEKAHLGAGAETKLPCGQEIQTLHVKSTSINPPSSDKQSIPLNGHIHSSLPEETAVSSIQSESELTFSNQQTTGDHNTKCNAVMSNGSVKHITSYSSLGEASCQLTASQKADVTELCTLLEEADSQFEFTQHKPVKQHVVVASPQKVDRDIDPDFLTGIDFDDSFSSDAEKHMAKTLAPDNMTSISDDKRNTGASNNTSKSTDVSFSSAMIKDNPSTGGAVSSTKLTSEASCCLVSAEPNSQHRTESSETSTMENKNPLTLSVAFKTAVGNALRVSQTCLSKARALFADLEENLRDQKLTDNQYHDTGVKTEQKCLLDLGIDNKALQYTLRNDCHKGEKIQGCADMKESVCTDKQSTSIRSKDATASFKNSRMDVTICQSGFHMASGKGISVSTNYMQQAEAFFKDCDGISVEHKRSIRTVAECVNKKKSLKPHVNRLTTSNVEVNDVGKATLALNNVPLLGNPFPTSKPFSSPLGTTSKGIDSFAIDELRSTDGFCTAIGEKVTVSAGAKKRAEYLFHEIHTPEDTKKQRNMQEDALFKGQHTQVLPPVNGGFQTASGKGVVISSAALKKAKTLLSECEDVEDKIRVKPSHFKSPVPGPPPRNGGFQTASGRGVTVSSEALKKAKTLLSECEGVEDEISLTMLNSKSPVPGPPPRSNGFQTASGKAVVISPAALKKAKTLLSECEDVEDKIRVTLPDSGPPCRNDGFVAAGGKPVVLPAEALQKAKALFSDIDHIAADSHTKKGGQEHNNQKKHCAFTTAGGAKVHVSEKSFLKAKQFLEESDNSTKEMQEVEAFFKDCDMEDHTGMTVNHVSRRSDVKLDEEVVPQNSGFQTASGRGVTVSSAALKKAKSLLSECDEAESKIRVKPSHFKSPLPVRLPRSSGFQTASGRGVTVSSEALKKAKTLLGEVEDETSLTLPNSKSPAPGPPSRNEGFQTASGKGVVISPAALKKAKTLLSECEDVEDKIRVKPSHFKSPVPGPPPRNGGFQTASGKGVTVSSEALKKAKALLSKCEEVEHEVSSTKTPVPAPSPKNSGFQTASGKGVVIPSEALKKAKSLLGECDDVEDEVSIKLPGSGSPHRNGGHLAPSGKSVELSAEALQKEKTLSSSSVFGAEMPSVSHTGSGGKIHCGFTTAGGAKVHVSRKSMMKAKHLLKDSDDSIANAEMQEVEAFFKDCDMDDVALRNCTSTGPANRSSTKKNSECMSDQRRTVNIHDEPGDESPENRNKQQTQSGALPPQNSGFQTASGKGVVISSAALKKAKTLLSECEDVEDKIRVKPSHFKSPVPAALPRSSRFQTASGKGVTVSSEALKKANTLLSECEGVEDEISLTKSPVPGPPPKNGGFQTASGKAVVISPAALKKAKTLLSECEDVEDKIRVTLPDSGPPCRNDGFVAAGGKPVVLPAEALQKAKALFSDIDHIAADSHTKKDGQEHNNQKKHCAFTTAGGAKVHVSEKSFPKAKHLLEESDNSTKEMQEVEAFFKDCDMEDHTGMAVNHVSRRSDVKLDEEVVPQNSGFQTASGRGVTVSSAALKRAKSLLSECDEAESKISIKPSHFKSPVPVPLPRSSGFQTASGRGVTVSSEALKKAKTLLGEVEDETSLTLPNSKSPAPAPPPRSNGFQTASGKGVVISPAALKKAKTLLSECEDVEDKIRVTLPDSGPPCRNGGFLAAGGKPVELSCDALQKAQVLFSDIPADTDIGRRANPHDHTEKVHSGFTTAGGANVHVSEKSLLRAKHLLKDFPDMESHNSDSESLHDRNKSDQLKVNERKRTTADDEDIPTRGSTCLKESEHVSETVEGGSVRDEAPEGNQTNGNKEPEVMRTDESSVLSFHSLNLTGCTETQQWFLAQEALDCTKALLEDEAGQSLQMTSQSLPLQDSPKSNSRSSEEGQGRWKRSAEDTDMNGQPPLKRRLLERFDRTVDGSRGSTLQPVKSCPNGVMKDRAVFKYSASLHPNTTKPHRDGSTFVETRLQKTLTQSSNSGDNSPAHCRMPAFVPPFIKNTKAEKNTVLKDNVKTSSVFVPPFKKQRTIVQESSFKAQEEHDKHYRPSVMPPNTYVPPTKTIQGSDVTLVDTTIDNTVNTESLPATCMSLTSGAEMSHVEDTFSASQDLHLENIELARNMQDMRIRKKKRQTIRPQPGSMFLTKTSGVARIPLKTAVNGKPPARYTQKQLYEYGVHMHVSDITSETATTFRFSLLQFVKREAFTDEGGIQLADGGWLIPKNDGTAGKEEFYRALCDTPGVDPKLISEAWVYNHYRWIVWKQASMEKSFPETMGSLCLTPEQVLSQLKYRYDVEVDNSRRPALRKIMEKDDTAAKTLVLCVCGVVSEGHFPKRRSVTKTPHAPDAKDESACAVVWLTDCWYAIKAQLDEPLTAMLHNGRLAVGGKLIIHGAQLVGSQDACSPLEAPESLMLKICANSSRPARWDAKLGFHRDPRPFLLPVSSLYSNGGPVGCVDIVILRSYPIQWMERKADGGVVFRSVRSEEKEARRHNNLKQKAMETLFAKIQAEFEREKGNVKFQRRRRTISHQDISSVQDGEELYEAIGDDPAYAEAPLSEQQLETLHAYRRSLMEKKQAELQDRYRRAVEAEDQMNCPKRDVTPVWRLCVSDSMNQHCSVYQLNLWRPSSDLQSLLKEGCRYKVYNLTTSDGKKRSGIETVQLTGTKKTQFQELQASKEWLSARFQPRVSTNFKNLQNPEFQPLGGEVDLLGCVVSILDGQGSSPAFYLADGELNFVKVRCFSSLSQSGLEDVVKPRALLALSNLQLRGQSMFPTPVVYAGDLTVFSTNTKEVHLQESLSQLKNLIQCHQNFFSAAEVKLSHLVQFDEPSSISSPALQPQTPISTTERSMTSQNPAGNLGFFTPVSKNAPAATSSTEKDPKSLKRRRALAYLSRIPSPPRLSNLGSMTSPSLKKTFNPPRRSGTPSTLKTEHTAAPKPPDSVEEDEWVNDEELAMIDTQALRGCDSL